MFGKEKRGDSSYKWLDFISQENEEITKFDS